MQVDNPKAAKLYANLINDGYTAKNLGDINDFTEALGDPVKADKIYNGLINDGYTENNLGTQKEFMQTFTQKKSGFTGGLNLGEAQKPLPAFSEQPQEPVQPQQPQPKQVPTADNNFLLPTHNQLAQGQVEPSESTVAAQPQQTLENDFNKANIPEYNKEKADYEQKVKDNIPQAINDAAVKSLKLKGIDPNNAALLNKEKSQFALQIAQGDATVGFDKDGKPGLVQTPGFAGSLWDHLKGQVNEWIDARQFKNMNSDERVNWANNKIKQAETAYIGTKPTQAGSVGALAGDVVPTIGRYAAGAAVGAGLEAVAPETGGLSNLALKPAMSFVMNEGTDANLSGMNGVLQRYYAGQQARAKGLNDLTDKELMAKAEEGEQVDRDAGILGSAVFSGEGNVLGKTVTKDFLKDVVKSGVDLGAKSAAIEGAKDVGHNIEGTGNKNSSEIGKDVLTAFDENAPMGMLLHAFMGGITGATKLPGLIKSGLKYDIINKMTPDEVRTQLTKNVQSGAITPEQAQKAEADLTQFGQTLQTVPPYLSDEAKASVTGLIEKRDNLLKQNEGLDKTAQDLAKPEIDAINNQIKEVYRTGKPQQVEINPTTGTTFEKPDYDAVAQQRVKDLASSIASGKTITKPEDLQTQANFPKELEAELQNHLKEDQKAGKEGTGVQENINEYLKQNETTEPASSPVATENETENTQTDVPRETKGVSEEKPNDLAENKPTNTEENNFDNNEKEVTLNNETENPSTKEQTATGSPEQSSNQTGESISGTGKEVKTLRKRAAPTIKNPLYLKALESEAEDPQSQVLKYFIGGGKINREALKEFHGDKKGELNAKISLQSSAEDVPKSIDDFAHRLWDNSPEHIQDRYSTEDFREAIENVLGSHNSRTTMAEELSKQVPEDDEFKTMMDWYDKTYGPHKDIEEHHFDHAVNVLEGLSDEEIQKIADDEKQSLEELAKQYSDVTEDDVKKAQSDHDNAKSKLSDAESKLAKEQGKQSDMFGSGVQKGLFGSSREDAKSILDPLRDKVKETKSELDRVQNRLNVQNERQQELFTKNTEKTLSKAEIRLAKEKIKKSDAEKIIEDEGLTLDNLKDFKHLFEGFPYEPEDYENIKNDLNGKRPTSEPAGSGQESTGNATNKEPGNEAAKNEATDTKAAGTEDAGNVRPEGKTQEDTDNIEKVLEAGIPFVKEFMEHDVTPRLEKIGGTFKDGLRSLVNLLSPKTGVSEKAITHLMRALGDRNAASTEIDKALSGLEKVFDKMKDEERIDFIDNIKTGKQQETPELQEVANTLKDLDKDLYDAIAKYKPSIAWKENHFRVLWKKIPGSEKTKFWSNLTRRPLQGSKGFFRQATLADMSEGISKGGEPYTTNPIRMFKLAYADGMKYVTAQRMFDALKGDKMVKFIKTGERPPDFFVPLNDNMAKVYFKSDAGLVNTGEYYIEEGAGRLLNNHLSRDYVREYSVTKGLMEIKNLYTQVELGLSGFHAIAEGLETVSSDLGLGMRKLINLGVRGNFKMAGEGIMDILKAPFSPKTTFTVGRNVIKFATVKDFENSEFGKAFLKKIPDAQQYLTDFFNGGGLLKQSEDLRANTFKALKEQAGKDNYIGAALRALPAMNEAILSPLFNHYIPALKVGMFFKEFPLTLKENESRLEKGLVTRDELARKTVNFIDDRLGEMNFDNLFWNRTFKSASQFFMRSVTWKLGNIRAMLGAVPEQAHEFINAAKEKRAPLLMPKAAWILGLSAMQVALSTVIMKMFANKTPQNFKDIVAPQINSDDEKDRVILPTYYKDIIHMRHSGLGYVTTSMSGPFSKLKDIWLNKDFYNYEIHDIHDGWLQKRKDDLLYFIPKPFSISSSVQQLENGDGGKAAMSFFGLNKAPGYLTNSDIENEIFDLYNQINTSVRPKAEKEGNDIKKQIRELYKTDKKDEAQEMADKAVKDGILRPTQIKYLFSHVDSGGSPAQFFFKELPYEDKKYLVGKMTEEEKKIYDPNGKYQ